MEIMDGRSSGARDRRHAPRDVRLVLADPRWRAAGRDCLLRWPVSVGGPNHGPGGPPARALTAAVIDTAFTGDLYEAVVAPTILRCFAHGTVLQAGPRAEHGTSIACMLTGTRWPEGCLPGARLLCAEIGEAADAGASLAAALQWIADERVDVLVLPFGAEEVDLEVASVLDDILSRPSPPLVVGALGNVFPAPGLFPAILAGVCAVAAADDDGYLLADAARSPLPDLVAPGDRILVRAGVARLSTMSGSSIACAVAAGAALRWLSLHPGERSGAALLAALRAPNPLIDQQFEPRNRS